MSVLRRWTPERPDTLVVACSDGRLQEATDDFLARHLGVTRYDRFYLPGGAGALAATGRDFMRAQSNRRECRTLIQLHSVQHVVLLFHGPAADGPIAAACADYRRKLPWALVAELRRRQQDDAGELRQIAGDWAGGAAILIYRCEVNANGNIGFVDLSEDVPAPVYLMPRSPQSSRDG